MFGKKPPIITKTFKNSKDRDDDVPWMAKKGYIIQSMMPEGGGFKAGKAAVLGVGGTVLLGPIGLAAAGLAGKKDTKWHVVFELVDKQEK